MSRRLQQGNEIHLPAGMQDKFLREFGRRPTITAHELAKVADLDVGFFADLAAPVDSVLLVEGFGVHRHKIFAFREDCKRWPRIAPLRGLRCNPPMDVKTIRRKNLALLKEREKTFDAIARRADIDPNYLSQINTGYRDMGDASARKIESAYGQPHGWMDTLHVAETFGAVPNIEPVTRTLQKVPLISWVSAGQLKEVFDPYQPGAAESWEEIEGPVSKQAYALRVRGDSMIAPDGTGFPDGSTIVVEPLREPKHRDYVVVRFPSSDEATFKQYVVDGPHIILKALNPAYPPIQVKSDAIIAGVVTEVIMRRKF